MLKQAEVQLLILITRFMKKYFEVDFNGSEPICAANVWSHITSLKIIISYNQNIFRLLVRAIRNA